MIRPSHVFFTCIACALTILPGYYHGMRHFRWGMDNKTDGLANALADFPTQVGNWNSISDSQLGETEMAMLEPIVYVLRTYQHEKIRANVFILLGPVGPTAEHTPEICFSAVDYKPIEVKKKISIGNQSTYWKIDFASRSVGSDCIRSVYGWSTDGNFSASKNPQWEFSSNRSLYKLQVDFFYQDRSDMDKDESYKEFVEQIAKTIQDRNRVIERD
jgi:hypothetical protein